MSMRGTVESVLLSEPEIQQRIDLLGEEINRDYAGRELLAVCLLKGSVVFMSDLIRRLQMPLTIDVMRASSYGDATESSGSVKILQDLDRDISGLDVLVVEDIVDTGRTLAKTLDLLRFRQPRSLKICTLLDKPSRREVQIPIDYTGFVIEDHFVVGYGLDFDEHYRQLPYIGILKL
ncbi:MAG: hypoxanthine phosphoribosyltransferase [Acidobacteria bacterium]|nr:hypoxanthine phosphoribosyltransferase [Acidobacteriota bacterium]